MPTFTYAKTKQDKACVAYIALLDGDPENPILVIKNTDSDKHTYIYNDGSVSTQLIDCEDDVIHEFYPGDSVTFTF